MDEQNNSNIQRLSEPTNLLQSDAYLRSKGKIIVPIGASADFPTYVKDLSKIPHALISGCSGAGKTSFVQTMIGCGVAKYNPDEIAFIIYDSKYVEYAMFQGIPHVYGEIAHTVDQIVRLVQWLDVEVETRLRKFSEISVRDINAFQRAGNRIPEIFLILDDFSEIERQYGCSKLLDKVLRYGRLTGVHCVLVTSMTSTKIITKELISNIPYRVAFRVTSKADSKVAIDSAGAELLRLPGEMICKSQSAIVKLQSAHMSISDLEKTVEHASKADKISLAAIGERAASIFSSYQNETKSSEEDNLDAYDELISQAVDVVLETGSCSVSILQRRFKLGYSRAARIIDQMEELGIVGPYEGAKPRQLLVTRNPFRSGKSYVGKAEHPGAENAVASTPSIGDYGLDDTDYGVSRNNADGNDDGNDVTLRDFNFFSTKGGTVSVYGNKVHIHGKTMTKLGSGHFSAEIPGKIISAIIFKTPSIFSGGYFTFNYYDDVSVENQSPHLVNINKRNVSEFQKIEIGSSDVGVVKMFLKQLSEDIRIPITYK